MEDRIKQLALMQRLSDEFNLSHNQVFALLSEYKGLIKEKY